MLEEILKEKGHHWNSSFPLGSTGSRLIRGHWPDFRAAEEEFCHWTGLPEALLFQSGYSANVGALSALTGPGDLVLCDRLCHASLLDGVRLSGAEKQYFHHNDLNHLEDLLRTKKVRKRKWVLAESVFSMDGDLPDLVGLVELCRRHDATLYLDEAHALGYYGSSQRPGAGLLAHAQSQLPEESTLLSHLIVSAPLGKAPGIMGGFVAGHPLLKEYLINRARSFIFSTAQPPVLAAMIQRILLNFREGVYNHRIHRLIRNAEYLREKLDIMGLDSPSRSAIIPVILGDAVRALQMSERLKDAGMDARAIRPPTVAENSSRLRVTVHSCHTEKEMDTLLDHIQKEK